jgi:pimeloyl-ACP methyl ester carboxylesterase
MPFRRIAAALVLCLALLAAPVGAQRAGTLIAADPVAETPGGMQAWRVSYWTRNEENRPIRATGMVVAPREAQPRSPRKVLAWTHGTWGVVEACAPSASPAFWTQTAALGAVTQHGYVVVAPDYPGLGSSGQHAYLVGRETARSVLDAVRAARSIPGAFVGADFAVWGESQGGHAALWTAAEARGYAPELRLAGTAAAAPPTDLVENLRQAGDENARAFLSALLAYSWSKRFDAPLDRLFGPLNRGVANNLAQKCISLDSKPNFGTLLGILSIRNALRGKDMANIPGWGNLARRNSIAARSVPGPVFLAQSVEDPLVAPAVTRSFARDLCRQRRAVEFMDIPGGDHALSARNSADRTLAWIADRFAGTRAPSDCRRI